MDVKKGYMKVGDDTVLPITSYDCIIDKDGNKLTESAESITQNTKAVANIQDYLGIDITKKRNLAIFSSNSQKGENGITFVLNSDGTIVANGTATATCYVYCSEVSRLSAGTYRVTGCPSGGSSNLRIIVKLDSNSGTEIASDTGNGSTFSITSESTIFTYVRIASGQSVSNLVFKPMLTTDLSATYADFVPYRKLITDEDVLTAEEISASTSLKSTDVASASAIKSVLPSIAVGGQLNLFFVFGSEKDGSYYFSNSLFVPFPYEIITSIANATVSQNGNVIYWYTSSSTLAGKGTNCIIRRLNT